MRFRIPRESLLVSSTSSTLCILLERLGAALGGGVVDGVAPDLIGGVGASGEGSWERGGEGFGECAPWGGRGGAGGVDVKEFPRTDIKYPQYLSLRESFPMY